MAVLSSARAVTLAEAILVDWELARVHDSQRCSEQIVAKLSTSGSQSQWLLRHYLAPCGSFANLNFRKVKLQISLAWSISLVEKLV